MQPQKHPPLSPEDPQPPFDSGSLAKANPALSKTLKDRMAAAFEEV